MNLIAENISHKYVQEELNKNIISTYKLQEMPNSFKGLHCIKGFQKGTLYLQHVQDTNYVTLDSLVMNSTTDFRLEVVYTSLF